MIPPLALETSILVGVGSYPEPGESLEQLLYHTSFIARNLTLRPALMSRQESIAEQEERQAASRRITRLQIHHNPPLASTFKEDTVSQSAQSALPHMKLPKDVPPRLRQLIPHTLAQQLRCVPVGRDHQNLTVAMADPTNREAVRHLQKLTSMMIFPVACDEIELNQLLEKKW